MVPFRKCRLLSLLLLFAVGLLNLRIVLKKKKTVIEAETKRHAEVEVRGLDSQTKAEKRMQLRRNTLREACIKHGLGGPRPFHAIHAIRQPLQNLVLFSDKYKALFCQIPKCGTRNQARFLATIEGILQPDMGDVEIKNMTRNVLAKSKVSDAALDGYSKVIVVREPFTRLVSAFLDKLRNNNRGDVYSYVARRISRLKESNTSREMRPTFGQFVRYLTQAGKASPYYSHWTHYHILCSPCEVNYDFIVHAETFQEDVEYLMERLGVKNISFPSAYKHNTNEMTFEFFSKLPTELSRRLYAKYRLDYELFGYQRPAILDQKLISVFT